MKTPIKKPAAAPSSHSSLWAKLPSSHVVNRWINELARLPSHSTDPDQWAICGKAVLLETDDLEILKDLVSYAANKVGMNFYYMSLEEVSLDLLDSLAELGSTVPTLVYIEPGRWLGGEDGEGEHAWPMHPSDDAETLHRFRLLLSQYLTESSSNKPIIITTGVRSSSQMDIALRRGKLFDRRIRLPEFEPEVIASSFIDDIGRDVFEKIIDGQHKRIGYLLKREFPSNRRRSLLASAINRLGWRENRLINFDDVVQFASFGTQEDEVALPDPTYARQHAIHEAGHALVTYLDSRDHTIPVYTSILKRGGALGVVITTPDAYEMTGEDLSYRDIIHKIKVCLAGRAAEYLLLGAEDVSARGALGDLEEATHWARLLMEELGHSSVTGTIEEASSNLLVQQSKPAGIERHRTDAQARLFLQKLFIETVDILKKNTEILYLIVKQLEQKTILFEEDFKKIVQSL
ncbi:Peptidase M41 [Oxalobacteraceae bacterium]